MTHPEAAPDEPTTPPASGALERPTGPEQGQDRPSGRATPLLDAALDKAVTIPSAAIRSHVLSVRRRNPEASPARIIELLEKEYVTVVTAAGGAVGAAAAVPAVGTGAALALTSSDVATFFAASSAFALAVADVHGIAVDDAARRRALLLTAVLGEKGARDVERAADGSPVAWGKLLLTRMPQGTIKQVNRALSTRFVRTQLTKQGSLALGRMVPFGVGAAVGLVGGRALGRGVVVQARAAFGPPPTSFGRVLEVIEGTTESAPPTLVPVLDPAAAADGTDVATDPDAGPGDAAPKAPRTGVRRFLPRRPSGLG